MYIYKIIILCGLLLGSVGLKAQEAQCSIDRKGMLLDVSKVISDQLGINIHKITISSDNGIFDGTIELRIHDREEVKTIMNQLRNIDDLQEVQRIL